MRTHFSLGTPPSPAGIQPAQWNQPDRSDESGSSILHIIFVIIEIVFVLCACIVLTAFILSMMGGNPHAPFSEWIYTRTTTLMKPFNGIFGEVQVSSTSTVHFSMLFAAFAYSVLAAIVGLFTRKLSDNRER